ncbi:MFS transporter [Phycicoccus sp.]|uniref:MFS transporter n=1 Tax=Phycicoccus sp. TaxID=1902410 RepID=UPI00345ED804
MSGPGVLRGLRVDLSPARESRDFRLMVLAGTVFTLGQAISYVAIPWQIYTLTGSNTMVGLIGVVELVPLLVAGLWGGALADHVDRKKMLVGTGAAQVALTALLALNAFRDEPHIWVLFVVAPFLVSAGALQRPSKEALLPRTVRHDQLPAANALNALGWQTGSLLGPTIGGLIVASAGAGWCFAVDVVGITVAVLLYARMSAFPHREQTTPPSLRGIAEGVRYAISRKDLLGTYFVDVAVMFLAMPIVLFPALAETIFARPHLLGLLYTSETVGALVASALSGWHRRIHSYGRVIVIAACGYGVFIAVAGQAPSFWLCCLALALAGAADMTSAVFRMTLWNQSIPENLRGRLAGIEMLSYSVGPLGAQIRAGYTADTWGVRRAISFGGVASVVGVVLAAAALQDFWRYDARTDEHLLAERDRRAAHGENLDLEG